ncbi:MAG: BatD family protein [Pseudomonadales bacterium]
MRRAPRLAPRATRHRPRLHSRWLPVAAALVAALLWAGGATAELRASIEPRTIDELGTARLSIRVDGTTGAQGVPLDVTPLEQDFEVLGTQSASQYRSINGVVQSWIEYQVTLRPRRSGTLEIPALKMGGETTTPLRLEVRPVADDVRDAIQRMVFFESTLSRNPVYVQGETVLTRRLYYSNEAQIYSDLPGAPEVANAVVMPLGEARSSYEFRDGQRYGMVEQRFALLPEQSGTLVIPSISVTSSVKLQSGGRTRRSGVRVSTERLELTVLPIPDSYPADQPWLPATDVQIQDRWEPDADRFEVGQPITRRLRIEAHGNVGSAIPPLIPELPEARFRQYPEPPDLDDDASGGEIVGSRVEAFAIIPTTAGTTTLPPVTLTWWDVVRDQLRTSTSAPRTLRVAPGPAGSGNTPAPQAATPGPPPASATNAPAPEDTPSEHEPVPDSEPATGAAPGADDLPRYLLPAVAALSLGVLLILLRRPLAAALAGLRRAAPGHPSDLPGHPRRSRPAQLGPLRRALQRAASEEDAAAVHGALMRYLAAFYDLPATTAVQRFRAAGHGAALDALNALCYAPPADDAGRPAAEVMSALIAAVQQLHRQRGNTPTEPLPELYA